MAPEAAHGAPGGLFTELLLIFVTALAAVAVCRPLRLPGTLGYFVAGALLGPTGFALIEARADIERLAEFGVVLLLFTLGLEFSLPRLLAMRRAVFGLGTLQVAVTTALFAGALAYAGLGAGLAVVLGGGLALSSTALVTRELAVTGQLRERHGQQALGVLLFQDLAAVFFLILVPTLAAGSSDDLGSSALLLLAKGIGVFVVLMLAGRYVLPPLFHEIARSRSDELFVLSALAVVLGSAWLTGEMGMSMALGGFVGGMMLGESRFRHQIEADIRPFRDILLGLFLVTVGMMLDLRLMAEYWPRVIAFGLILMLVKGLIIVAIAAALGERRRSAVRTAVVLAQGGEFSFALLALAAAQGLVPADVQAFMVAVTLVSMVLTPVLVRRSGWITDRILGPEAGPAGTSAAEASPRSGHVVLLGFGRVGQVLGRVLEESAVDYLALDSDPARVAEAGLAGVPVLFGDASRSDILHHLGIAEARLVVICIDDNAAAMRCLEAIRRLDDTVPVLVRARDESWLDAFLEAGATEVVPETFESALMLMSHLMVLLRRPRAEVESLLARVRADRYGLLHGVIPGQDPGAYPQVVHPILLPANARAVGRPGSELRSLLGAVAWKGVRRRGRSLEPADDIRIEPDDIVVVMGPPEEVEAAEGRLLGG